MKDNGFTSTIYGLQSEKMKHLLSSRYRSGAADPHVALMRDVAIVGGSISDSDGNQVDQQVASLEALVTQQRRTQCRMAKVLKDAEIRHRSVCEKFVERVCCSDRSTIDTLKY